MIEVAKTVLIVDDEPEVCLLIGDELSACGFDCHSVSDSYEARSLLCSDHFDLLITDIAMPGFGGLDLLAFARQHAPACKVILTTGLSNRRYLARALLLGACDYVEKPFATNELTEAARNATAANDDISQLSLRAAAALEEVSRRGALGVGGQQATQVALDSVRALSRAVEARDPYTRRHSEHVAHYATSLAESMGAAGQVIKTVRIAALLHDIGKIGVPDHILTKPGKLTDDEFEFIRRHPALGADILADISLFAQEAMVVRYHHENWDGGGYPRGLVGAEIPWAARVINVADSMDAMLMERTYKDPYAVDRMLGELRICSGRQFDPAIAEMAVTWCGDNMDMLIRPNQPVEALV